MKRRYYNPFLDRSRARGAGAPPNATHDDQEHLGALDDELSAADGASPASAVPDVPSSSAARHWYLLPPGMSVTMALARLPKATRAAARRATPLHMVVASTVIVLMVALVLLQVGLLQPVQSLFGGSARGSLPAGNDWTQYRFDIAGTGATTEDTLSSANVGKLTQRWVLHGYSAFESTPALVDGVIYVTNGNTLYAFDPLTGKQLWRHDNIAQQISTMNSSVAIDPATHLAYYGNPDARVYGVDIHTGKRVWVTQLSTQRGAFVWSSPLLVNHTVYIGLASQSDNPCIRGAIYALDPSTGAILWTHYTAAEGELGGGVWSTLAADPGRQEVIATSGNPCPTGPSDVEQDSIIGINWNTGVTDWKYTAIADDVCDCDFGQGPALFTYQGHDYIVAGNKYGMVYGLRRGASGTPTLAWSVRIAWAGFLNFGGIFEPPTYGNGLVYISGGPSRDGACPQGALWAFHADTGAVAWRACTAKQVVSPAVLVNGVLLVAQSGVVVAYQASTGNVLAKLPIDSTAWGGVTVSHGQVLVGTVAGKLYSYYIPGMR